MIITGILTIMEHLMTCQKINRRQQESKGEKQIKMLNIPKETKKHESTNN